MAGGGAPVGALARRSTGSSRRARRAVDVGGGGAASSPTSTATLLAYRDRCAGCGGALDDGDAAAAAR